MGILEIWAKNFIEGRGGWGGGGKWLFLKSAKIFVGKYFDCLFSIFVMSLKQDIYEKIFFFKGEGPLVLLEGAVP